MIKEIYVPDKFIRLIALTLIHIRARVKVNRDFTEEFMVKCGVKQGDPLSATVFSLVTDTILKQMELRGNITTRLEQCIAYADDILLTTRTKRCLLDTFQKLKEISAQYGLIVNGQKTKHQLDAPMYQIYFILELHSTCFGWSFPSIIRSSRLYIERQAFVKQILLPAC